SFDAGQVDSDQQLLERIRLGDEKVLVRLYQNNIAMVRKYVLDNSGRDEDAQDMLQDALIVLWENVMRGDFNLTSKISTYLYSVVRNKWLREINKRKVGKTTSLENYEVVEERIDALKQIVRKEEYKVVLKCIESMGATCRKVLTMFYLEEKGMEEIARVLKFANTDVAKAKKWQCKKELESLVKKSFYNPKPKVAP
ncbi:MAG: sigma-70 family RNA polymerase sigma factor, partial [Bacteroidetes bacterium]|nr:sigma-70 family RNA polymerase sigma factor [Bacteroidota bacterium]